MLDGDAAGLRHLRWLGARDEAKTVLADAAAGVNHDAVADQRVHDRRACSDHAIAANRNICTDHGIRPDDGSRSDLDTRPDHGARVDRDLTLQPRRRMNGCVRRDIVTLEQRGRAKGAWIERAVNGDEGPVRLLRAQHDEMVGRPALETFRHQADARMGRSKIVGVFVALDEGKVRRSCEFERSNVLDQVIEPRTVANLNAGERNDLRHRQAGRAVKKSSLAHFSIPNSIHPDAGIHRSQLRNQSPNAIMAGAIHL